MLVVGLLLLLLLLMMYVVDLSLLWLLFHVASHGYGIDNENSGKNTITMTTIIITTTMIPITMTTSKTINRVRPIRRTLTKQSRWKQCCRLLLLSFAGCCCVHLVYCGMAEPITISMIIIKAVIMIIAIT